jgi:urease accessory protein
MRARARVVTEVRGAGPAARTRVSELRSEAPLSLRSCNAKGPEPWAAHLAHLARVSVVASAAGPVGGDHYRLEVHVGAGSNLVLNEISATLLLPGRDGARSRTDVRIEVDPGATLIWMPEPLIAVRGCDHVNDVRIELGVDARLLVREETVLGRHREPSGRVRQSVRVRRGSRQVYRQDVELGTPAGRSPAVAGRYRAVGSTLLFDPDLERDAALAPPVDSSGTCAVMTLAHGGVLITAVGDDTLELRRQLSSGLAALGPPWHPEAAPTRHPATRDPGGTDAGPS